MVKWIEKLINEHGSAAILRERLEACQEQNANLREELSKFKERVKNLEVENESMRAEIERTKEEVKMLTHSQPITVNTRFDPRKP